MRIYRTCLAFFFLFVCIGVGVMGGEKMRLPYNKYPTVFRFLFLIVEGNSMYRDGKFQLHWLAYNCSDPFSNTAHPPIALMTGPFTNLHNILELLLHTKLFLIQLLPGPLTLDSTLHSIVLRKRT